MGAPPTRDSLSSSPAFNGVPLASRCINLLLLLLLLLSALEAETTAAAAVAAAGQASTSHGLAHAGGIR